jgi:hypothetical protein
MHHFHDLNSAILLSAEGALLIDAPKHREATRGLCTQPLVASCGLSFRRDICL